VEIQTMKSVRLTAAAAIVRFLQKQYTERDGTEHRLIAGAFGIFGHGNVAGLGQALEEYGGRALPFIQPKNEQAMVHMAAAYAKAKKRLSTFACTTSIGPGATNMLTGAAGATINRIPVLLLPGDIFSSRASAPVLQQLEHFGSQEISVNDAFRPVSRYWDRIHRPEQLLAALPEAMRVLSDPAHTGAVTLCLPQDTQTEGYDYPASFFEKKIYSVLRTVPPADVLDKAVRRLAKAKSPLIVAGGGIHYSEATRELAEFAHAFGIPVAVTQAGKGSLLDDDPMCVGALGATGTQAANRIAKNADVVLLIGTRLSDFTTASKTAFQNDALDFVSINVSSLDAHKHGAIPLVGDARVTLTAMSKILSEKKYSTSSAYQKKIASERNAWDHARAEVVTTKGAKGMLSQARVIDIVNEAAAGNGTIVHAAGGLPGDLHKLWNTRHPDAYHSEYGYSCMGYEIAGAIGVKMARPERWVIAMVGDGSFLMLSHDLLTALQENVPITVVLLDNHGFQCIRKLQTSLGGKSFGNEFRARPTSNGRLTGSPLQVDYVGIAKGLGLTALSARTEDELKNALARAQRDKKATLIHVPIDPNVAVPGYESWWEVAVAEVSGQSAVRKARSKYMTQKKKQRFYY
jgi:3D-(3,5/4)-trihydroxycyclohexane-1,2-dione acylhydrolase (decyclizing)